MRRCRRSAGGRNREHVARSLSAREGAQRYRMGNGELTDAMIKDGLWDV